MDNLSPGKRAPDVGTYACCFCGPGGFAEILVTEMRAKEAAGPGGARLTLLGNADITTPLSTQVSLFNGRIGVRFPECPTCGPATGWDLVSGGIDEYLQHRVESREFVFDTLSIGRAEACAARTVVLDGLTITKVRSGRRRRWPFGRRAR